MKYNLSNDEIKNMILLLIDFNMRNDHSQEVKLDINDILKSYENDIKNIIYVIDELNKDGLLMIKNINGNIYKLSLTDKSIALLNENNNIQINKLALILLFKSYEYINQKNKDTFIRLDSWLLGYFIGVSNQNNIFYSLDILKQMSYIADINKSNHHDKDSDKFYEYYNYSMTSNGIVAIETFLNYQRNNDITEMDLSDLERIISFHNNKKTISTKDIFIVHGRNETIKEQVKTFLKDKLGLNPIILHEQPNAGHTIIGKFEKYSNVVAAIALFTADDIGNIKEEKEKLNPRARQNVIFEAGFFMGKLGLEYTIILYEKGVELLSDLHGFLYIRYDDNLEWQNLLYRELKNIGYLLPHSILNQEATP